MHDRSSCASRQAHRMRSDTFGKQPLGGTSQAPCCPQPPPIGYRQVRPVWQSLGERHAVPGAPDEDVQPPTVMTHPIAQTIHPPSRITRMPSKVGSCIARFASWRMTCAASCGGGPGAGPVPTGVRKLPQKRESWKNASTCASPPPPSRSQPRARARAHRRPTRLQRRPYRVEPRRSSTRRS